MFVDDVGLGWGRTWDADYIPSTRRKTGKDCREFSELKGAWDSLTKKGISASSHRGSIGSLHNMQVR